MAFLFGLIELFQCMSAPGADVTQCIFDFIFSLVGS